MSGPVDPFAGILASIEGLRAVVESAREVVTADRAVLLTRIAELEQALDETDGGPRYPGDPGLGRMLVGAATSGREDQLVSRHERPTGHPVAFRQYWNAGIGDLAVPNGPVAKAITRDHAAGRTPVVSVKPGIEALAAHRFGPELVTALRWMLRTRRRVVLIAHHEPANDWKADAGNLTRMATHARDFRLAQQWVRACLDLAVEQEGEPNETVMFAGSLMTYNWTPEGRRKFGPSDAWNPGRMPDGSHVWHTCGLDHYTEANEPMVSPKLTGALASLEAWGVRPSITELGVRAADPQAALKIGQAHDLMLEHDGPLFLYYDSAVNSTGAGWLLEGAGLEAFHAIIDTHDDVPGV